MQTESDWWLYLPDLTVEGFSRDFVLENAQWTRPESSEHPHRIEAPLTKESLALIHLLIGRPTQMTLLRGTERFTLRGVPVIENETTFVVRDGKPSDPFTELFTASP